MKTPPINKENIIRKLETIYWHALSANRWYTALQAASLQGRNLGMFIKPRLPEITRIKDMDEDQLREFVERLEKHDPELKKLEIPPPDDPQKNVSQDYNSYPETDYSPPPQNLS